MFPRREFRHAYGYHGYRDDNGGGDGGGDGSGGDGGGDSSGGDSSSGADSGGGWSGTSSSVGGASLSGLGGLGGFAGPSSQGYGGAGSNPSTAAYALGQETSPINPGGTFGVDATQGFWGRLLNQYSSPMGLMGGLLSLSNPVSAITNLGINALNAAQPGTGSILGGLYGLARGNPIGGIMGLARGIASAQSNPGVGFGDSSGTSLGSSIGGSYGAGDQTQPTGLSAMAGPAQTSASQYGRSSSPLSSAAQLINLGYNTSGLNDLIQLYNLSQQGQQG